MLSRSCRPSGHAVSRKRSGWTLAPSSQSAERRLIPTRRRGGAPVRSRCHRSARALGTWLACHWWRRDGKPLAGRVRRCCREAAAPPGTPFLGNDPGGGWRLPLNPRSDDSSRLVDEVAHRCGRGVIAPPAPLGPGWRVTGGGVMASHWQDACVDAVAKLPPPRARRFSETIRVEVGAFLSIRAATTHPDSSTRWRTGAVAVSSLRPRPWDLVGVSLVAA